MKKGPWAHLSSDSRTKDEKFRLGGNRRTWERREMGTKASRQDTALRSETGKHRVEQSLTGGIRVLGCGGALAPRQRFCPPYGGGFESYQRAAGGGHRPVEEEYRVRERRGPSGKAFTAETQPGPYVSMIDPTQTEAEKKAALEM